VGRRELSTSVGAVVGIAVAILGTVNPFVAGLAGGTFGLAVASLTE